MKPIAIWYQEGPVSPCQFGSPVPYLGEVIYFWYDSRHSVDLLVNFHHMVCDRKPLLDSTAKDCECLPCLGPPKFDQTFQVKGEVVNHDGIGPDLMAFRFSFPLLLLDK